MIVLKFEIEYDTVPKWTNWRGQYGTCRAVGHRHKVDDILKMRKKYNTELKTFWDTTVLNGEEIKFLMEIDLFFSPLMYNAYILSEF